MDEALILLTRPPYGRVHAVEALRLASGMKAQELDARIVMIGEAIISLLKNQDGRGIHMPAMDAALDILAMSEAPIAVVQEDMDILGITKEDLIDYAWLEVIDREELEARVAASKCAMRF